MDVSFLKSAAAQVAPRAIELRREIHRNPELSDQEEQTVALVCRELERLDIPYTVLPGIHAVVAMISSGKEGPTVGLRADMDALPIQEQSELPYTSQNTGVMHACGHDVHTAVLLGTASVLAKNKDRFRGNVKLFFQPAEENIGGAKRMIAAGCMEDPHVDAVFGLHSSPRLPVGKIGTKPGWTSASSAPYRPVFSMSAARTAASRLTPSGIRAQLASTSRMRAYSAMSPSSELESFWPVMRPLQCWWAPS